jgi:membrane protease YdiL (CAAX protease family)
LSKTFGLLVLLTLLISCLVAPGVYWGILSSFDTQPWPYSRVFDRVILVVLVVLLYRKRREFNLSKIFGIINPKGHWRLFALGLALSVGASALMLPFFIFSGDLSWNIREVSHYLTRVPKVLLGAIITAFLEEFIFRGILFGELRNKLKQHWAILVTTLIYAMVHFIAPNKGWEFPGYSLTVGFEYLGVVVSGILNPQHFLPFIGLCFVGLVLIRAYVVTGSLVLSVGLHAGWILAVKSVFHLTALSPEVPSGLSPLATRYFLVSSPVAGGSVLLVGLIISFIFRKKS